MRIPDFSRSCHALCIAGLLAAALLAGCASHGGVPDDLDPVSSPEWATDMARFAAEDAATPPPERPIVFTGSSSVRMWETLAADFPDVPVLNRGFGGSQVRDSVWYADEVALRYRPRQIVLYAGDNDIAEGRSAAQVLADTEAFVVRIRSVQPGTPIALLGIKPSPSRAHLLDVQRDANQALRDWAATQRNVAYIDVFTPMLDAEGMPREDLFIADRLHMNAAGYAMWRAIIGPYLVR
ncbi:GDSL-type esterase/lipase family protein [Luteimonas sp. XNQY3]|nr:SGNH/GDSL hydrolase family protein [Luteimonas sp. XNQY3]MCD9005600.1 GDSL-type esterase/lipase family protein [Luteimonas sp. XNQY3]